MTPSLCTNKRKGEPLLQSSPYYRVGTNGPAVTGDNNCLTRKIAIMIHPLAASKEDQEAHRNEIRLFHNFWYGKEYLHAFPGYWQVRQTFHPPQRSTCAVFLKDDRNVTVQFTIFESRNLMKGGPCVNLVSICGILYNSETMIPYAHLHSYQKRLRKSGELPGFRVIVWGPNDIFNSDGRQYIPTFNEEIGKITSTVSHILTTRFGRISWYGHSMGAAYALAGLSEFEKPTSPGVPPALFLDRGFTSFENACWNVGYGAYALYSIAKRCGFAFDAVARLIDFFSKADKSGPLPKVTLLSAINDHRFYGRANYCFSDGLRRLAVKGVIQVLGVQLTHLELTHEQAAHSFPLNRIQKSHCKIKMGPAFFEEGENVEEAFLRQIFTESQERKES